MVAVKVVGEVRREQRMNKFLLSKLQKQKANANLS